MPGLRSETVAIYARRALRVGVEPLIERRAPSVGCEHVEDVRANSEQAV
jgi:hypothetical protein